MYARLTGHAIDSRSWRWWSPAFRNLILLYWFMYYIYHLMCSMLLNFIILPPRFRCLPQGLFSMYQTPPQMPEHNPSHYSCSDSLLVDDGLVTVKASEDRTISLELAILVFFFSDSVQLACAFSPFVSSYRAIFVSALRSWEDTFCSRV